MKNGICPKCNKSEVYYEKGFPYGSEQIILKSAFLIGKGTSPDKYICTFCGYLEYYIATEEDIKIIKESWKKI